MHIHERGPVGPCDHQIFHLRSPLLVLNKQIRAEACSYLHSSINFVFDFGQYGALNKIIYNFSSLSPESRNAIRIVTLLVGHNQLLKNPLWITVWRYLKEHMHILHLTLYVGFPSCAEHHTNDQSCDSVAQFANIDAPWIREMIGIQNLRSLNLHTWACQNGMLCGFSPEDAGFNENSVWEDDADYSDSDGPLTTGQDGESSMNDINSLHRDCLCECFPRAFIEQVRHAVGLEIGAARQGMNQAKWFRAPLRWVSWNPNLYPSDKPGDNEREWWAVVDDCWWTRMKAAKASTFGCSS